MLLFLIISGKIKNSSMIMIQLDTNFFYYSMINLQNIYLIKIKCNIEYRKSHDNTSKMEM